MNKTLQGSLRVRDGLSQRGGWSVELQRGWEEIKRIAKGFVNGYVREGIGAGIGSVTRSAVESVVNGPEDGWILWGRVKFISYVNGNIMGCTGYVKG